MHPLLMKLQKDLHTNMLHLKNFYHYLHKLDQSKCQKIAVVEIPNKGLGKTINDRLRRAIK